MLASVLCFVHAPTLYPLVAQEGSGILRPETGSGARRGAPRASPSSRRAIESPTAHQRGDCAPAGSAPFQSVFVAPEIPNGRLESLARRAAGQCLILTARLFLCPRRQDEGSRAA